MRVESLVVVYVSLGKLMLVQGNTSEEGSSSALVQSMREERLKAGISVSKYCAPHINVRFPDRALTRWSTLLMVRSGDSARSYTHTHTRA